MSVVISRPINGVTINGREYILDDGGDVQRFVNEEAARVFLHNHGLTDDEIADQGIEFMEE